MVSANNSNCFTVKTSSHIMK